MKPLHFIILLLGLLPRLLVAAPGDLDLSFGTGGKVISSSTAWEGIAVQADGKLVTIGGGYGEFQLERFNADGSIDTTFGGGTGQVATSFGSQYQYQIGFRLAVQADGKIVAAGYVWMQASGSEPSDFHFALARYLPDGNLDPSFGSGGKITTALNSPDTQGLGLALQSDGKIVVSGSAVAQGGNHFALARYLANGSLDASFGSGGLVYTAIDVGDSCLSVAVQSDGKIVAGGSSYGLHNGAGGWTSFALVRYNADGSLDMAFNGTGKVTTSMVNGHETDTGRDVLIQGDGKIVLAGEVDPGGSSYSFGIARYNSDGSLDTSFGGSGKVVTAVMNDLSPARGAVLQTDGKIVVVGFLWDGHHKIAVARYNPNGSLDASFGVGGQVSTLVKDFSGNDAMGQCVAIQKNGEIVVGGFFNSVEITLVRYLGAPPLMDWDRNGTPDLVLFNSSTGQSTVDYLRSNTLIGTASGPSIPAGWQLVKVGDVNGDGRPDYYLFNPSNGALAGWKLNGTTFVSTTGLPTLPPGWTLAAVADLNRDGNADLVLFNPTTQGQAVWLLNGTSILQYSYITQAGVRATIPAGFKIAAAADFNADGRPDLVLFNPTTRQTIIWYLNDTVLSSQTAGPTLAAGGTLAGVADFNADGQPDLLVFTPATRKFHYGILSGLTVLTAPYIVDGTGAQIVAPAGFEVVAP